MLGYRLAVLRMSGAREIRLGEFQALEDACQAAAALAHALAGGPEAGDAVGIEVLDSNGEVQVTIALVPRVHAP